MKLLFAFFLTLFCAGALQAQTSLLAIKPEKVVAVEVDTTSNTDTTTLVFNGIGGKVKSFQASVVKVSGTVAGKVYLQGTVNGNDWVNLDSLTATNVSLSTKVFPITATTYYSYRAYYITTGTQASYLTFAYLRRQDE